MAFCGLFFENSIACYEYHVLGVVYVFENSIAQTRVQRPPRDLLLLRTHPCWRVGFESGDARDRGGGGAGGGGLMGVVASSVELGLEAVRTGGNKRLQV
jgi:hypothetical protein